jgi:hypothetical protein
LYQKATLDHILIDEQAHHAAAFRDSKITLFHIQGTFPLMFPIGTVLEGGEVPEKVLDVQGHIAPERISTFSASRERSADAYQTN